MKVATKLILILICAIVSIMAIYALITVSRTQARMEDEIGKMAEHLSMSLNVGVVHHLVVGDAHGVDDVVQRITQYEDVAGAAVYDRHGRLVASAGTPGPASVPSAQTRVTDHAEFRADGIGQGVFTYQGTIHDDEGRVAGRLWLMLGGRSLLPHVQAARDDVLVTILVLTVTLSAITIFFSRRHLAAPLQRLTRGAIAVGEGRLDHRIEVEQDNEIGQLSGAFNEMAASVESMTTALQDEKDHLRSVVNSISEGIVVLNRDGRVTAWNGEMTRRYGLALEVVLGKRIDTVLPEFGQPPLGAHVRDVLDKRVEAFQHEVAVFSIAPERRISVTGAILRHGPHGAAGAVLILADITDRLELEEHLQRADKLAATGQLAAGIAHEIGTPLNVISGSAELLKMDLEEADPKAAELKTIVEEVSRITGLVSQLLEFSRLEEPRREAVRVSELLPSVLQLLEPQLQKAGITVDVDLLESLPPIEGDGNQLHQVMLNLLMNAWQAMPDGGCLSVAARLAPDNAVQAGRGNAGQRIAIAVTDTGAGISRDHLGRIFEPFFTTKEVGTGTGLGLAIAQRIIENHGGQIAVNSSLDGGTTFTVTLPVHNTGNDR